MKGHDAYRYTGGFNLRGLMRGDRVPDDDPRGIIRSPGEIRSGLFPIFTGSGFDALFGGVLYWLASLYAAQKYMLRDRDDLEIVSNQTSEYHIQMAADVSICRHFYTYRNGFNE